MRAGRRLAHLGFDLVGNQVNGSIHVVGLFGGGKIQAFTVQFDFRPVTMLVKRKNDHHVQRGRLAQKTSGLFQTATGILLEVFRGFEVLEGEFHVHEVPPLQHECGAKCISVHAFLGLEFNITLFFSLVDPAGWAGAEGS